MSIKERIGQLIVKLEVKPATFEKAIGLSNSYLRNVKNVSAETCAKIKDVYPSVSLNWLLLGDGEMFESGDTNDEREHSTKQEVEGVENNFSGSGDITVLNVGDISKSQSKRNAEPSRVESPKDYADLSITQLLSIIATKESHIERLLSSIEKKDEQLEKLINKL